MQGEFGRGGCDARRIPLFGPGDTAVNYFAHGRQYTSTPYFLAGTAVPDWLSVVDRRVRVRRSVAEAFDGDGDPRAAAVARGIVQHLVDDDWFHRSRAFIELSTRLTVEVHRVLRDDDGLRPQLLGHILVEILLDATLIAANPALLDAYYRALAAVDPLVVQATVNHISRQPTDRLALMIEHFARLRILSDYLDDETLFGRLNQVMRRIGVAELPQRFLDVLPECRRLVSQRSAELMTPCPPGDLPCDSE
jgi:hypothetical protein